MSFSEGTVHYIYFHTFSPIASMLFDFDRLRQIVPVFWYNLQIYSLLASNYQTACKLFGTILYQYSVLQPQDETGEEHFKFSRKLQQSLIFFCVFVGVFFFAEKKPYKPTKVCKIKWLQ